MMKKIATIALFLFIACRLPAQTGSENLFYMTDNPESFESFMKNLNQVSVVCPQTFLISREGVLSGSVDRRIVDTAHKYKIKLVPLIVNSGFSSQLLHAIVTNPQVRKRSIRMMLDYAKQYKLDGWQFDLEGLNIADRDSFTVYFRETAIALHQAGLSLSAAIVHTVENVGGPTPYHNFLYENWRAGYALKEMAMAGDFLSIMAYDQHTRRTPPGPVAGADWVERIVQFLLNEGVPAEKISLGIPDYSVRWFPDYTEERGGFSNGQQLGYKNVDYLLQKNNAQLKWDEKAACHYAIWENDGVYEYMYIEDGSSLRPKLKIMQKYKLRGISVWVLGKEAPDFWKVLNEETTKDSR
jgi:spore germination protein YaaH